MTQLESPAPTPKPSRQKMIELAARKKARIVSAETVSDDEERVLTFTPPVVQAAVDPSTFPEVVEVDEADKTIVEVELEAESSESESETEIDNAPWWCAPYTPLTPPDEADEYRARLRDGFDPDKWGFDQYEIDYNPSWCSNEYIGPGVITDEETLDGFLDAHKIASGELCSHVAIGGYRGGRWFIPLVMNNKFLVLFFRDSILAKRPIGMCEKILRDRNLQFFVDWEMDSPAVYKDFLEKNSTDDLAFLREFGTLCGGFDSRLCRTRFIISRNRDFPNKLHINFPAVYVSMDKAKELCDDLKSRFVSHFFTDDESWKWDKIFDKGPYDNGGLRMLGARKEGQRNSYQVIDLRTGEYEPLHIQQLVQTRIRNEYLKGTQEDYPSKKIVSEYEVPIRKFAAELNERSVFASQTLDIVDVKSGFDNRSFVVDLKDDFCPYIGRPHSRTSNYMYLFITRFGCWLKCYDEDCRLRNNHQCKDLPAYLLEMFDDVEQELDPSGVKSIVRKEWGNGDSGMAKIAHHFLKDDVSYSSTTKTLYFYKEPSQMWVTRTKNEFIWVLTDVVEKALRPLLRKYVDEAAKEAGKEEPDKQRQDTLDQCAAGVLSNLKKYKSTKGVSFLYPQFEGLITTPNFESKFDQKPYLLGVKNGVIDLKTGELRERTRDDNLFRLCPIEYDPNADTSFVDEMYMATMADDKEMMDYLQLCLGYAITGETKEEIVLVFTGQGRNTKGTTMQTMKRCLGEFMGTMNNGIIIRRTGGNMDAERARLQGLRVALFNELGDGEVLNTAELQMLSGSDGINIKRLYCDPTEIETPTHKCLITTNHSPSLPMKEITTSIIERLIIIDFGVEFVDLLDGEEPTLNRRQCDKDLKSKLAQQLHVFLKWLVVGAVRYYRDGGKIKQKAPQKVKDATNAYFEKQNVVKRFVDSECTRGNTDEYFEECTTFFGQFQSWNKGGADVNQKSFVFGLKQLGITSKQVRIRGTTFRETRYIGVRMKPVETLEEGAIRENEGCVEGGEM